MQDLLQMLPAIAPIVFNALYVAMLIKLLSACVLSWITIRIEEPYDARMLYRIVIVHFVIILGYLTLVMITFLWSRSDVIPQGVGGIAILLAFTLVESTSDVNKRIETYLKRPKSTPHPTTAPNKKGWRS